MPVVQNLLNSRHDDAKLRLRIPSAHHTVMMLDKTSLLYHELFDKINADVEDYIDLIVERAVQLGGVAEGTARVVAKNSSLSEYDVNSVSGRDHIEALGSALASFGKLSQTLVESSFHVTLGKFMVVICTNGKIMVSTSLACFDESAAKAWSRKRQIYGRSDSIRQTLPSTMEVAMTDEKSILLIGLDPTLIDFSVPDFAATGMDAPKILAGLKSTEQELTRLGYSVQTCLVDFGETAEAVVQKQLKLKPFDCILIGAGIRAIPSNFILFEKLINVVHEHAPHAKLCFNTNPSDSVEAVQRWL